MARSPAIRCEHLVNAATTMPGSPPADEIAALEAALRRRLGQAVRIENAKVATLGGSNRTLVFDCMDGAACRRLVSRRQTYHDASSPFLDPAHQFRIMQVAHAAGIPVPRPVLLFEPVDDIGAGYITEFVDGETMPRRILGDPGFAAARAGLAAQCGTVLAQIHALDTGPLAFLATRPDSIDPIDAERQRLDVYDEAHPAIELGLRWLERHRPRTPAQPMLVHGDFRIGNLMGGGDGLRAVLDWECTRLGDGMLDIGWLCMRSWRFGRVDRPVGGFGDRAALYTAYHVAGGAIPDPELVHYWEIAGLVRWACLNVMQGHGHVLGGRRSVVYAAAGRNSALIEYELLMTLAGRYH